MSTHISTATGPVCVLCDGPCKHTHRINPVHENYPFMSKEAIAMTQPIEPAKPTPTPKTKRAKRRGENRAHTADEGENR